MKRKLLCDLSGHCAFVQLMSKWSITKKESSLGALQDGKSLEPKDSHQMSFLFSALFFLRWEIQSKMANGWVNV